MRERSGAEAETYKRIKKGGGESGLMLLWCCPRCRHHHCLWWCCCCCCHCGRGLVVSNKGGEGGGHTVRCHRVPVKWVGGG